MVPDAAGFDDDVVGQGRDATDMSRWVWVMKIWRKLPLFIFG